MRKLSGLTVLLFILVSCDFLLEEAIYTQEYGGLNLNIVESGIALDRTLIPDIVMEVDSYVISGSGPIGSYFTETLYSGSNLVLNTLDPGTWTISVDARNSSGYIIADGDVTINIVANNTTFTTVTVSPITGYGSLSLALSWPTGSITTPVIVAGLTSDTSFDVFNFSISGNSATYYDNLLVTGYYELSIVLMDGEEVMWGNTEAVRIVNSQTTFGDYDITDFAQDEQGDIDIEIITNIENPLDITLAGSQSSLLPGSSMTVTATVSETPDSYQWYLNGEILYGETSSSITIGNTLAIGTYGLDLIVTKGAIISSEGFTFNVSNLITLDATLYAGSYPSEVSWSILDEIGTVVDSGDGYTSGTHTFVIKLPPGSYTFVAEDSYGDGWNSAYFTLYQDNELLINQFTFTTGYSAETTFEVGDPAQEVMGAWTLYFDWAPTDTYYSSTLTLNADYTFDTGDSFAGMWSFVEGQLTLSFDNGTSYVGTGDGTYLSGTMTGYDGSTGIWYADRY